VERIAGPRITPAPGMTLVTLKAGMSAYELGGWRLVPAYIEPGQAGLPGDVVEVDPETADRWIAADVAEAYAEVTP
jgi:hypothetical protein